jgi:hypothetical protein
VAQRYGGKYSPEGSSDAPEPRHAWAGARRTRAGGRVNLLFLAPLPLIFLAFFKEPVGLALDLAGGGVLLLAAWLTREGVLAQEAYDARKVAKRPAIPRKLFGAVLIGAGLFLAGFSGDAGLMNPILFGLLGAVLHFLAFGADPLTDKGAEGIDAFQTERVARAVNEAEKHLSDMSDAVRRAEDRGVERRVERFQSTVRDLFRTVEEDAWPRSTWATPIRSSLRLAAQAELQEISQSDAAGRAQQGCGPRRRQPARHRHHDPRLFGRRTGRAPRAAGGKSSSAAPPPMAKFTARFEEVQGQIDKITDDLLATSTRC